MKATHQRDSILWLECALLSLLLFLFFFSVTQAAMTEEPEAVEIALTDKETDRPLDELTSDPPTTFVDERVEDLMDPETRAFEGTNVLVPVPERPPNPIPAPCR